MFNKANFSRSVAVSVMLLMVAVGCQGCGGGGNGAASSGGSGGGSGAATLSWSPPTQNTDGTPLTAAGFRVYYGTASRHYGAPIDVGDVTSYVLGGLQVGQTYYFAVTAYDSGGNESAYSTEVSKTL